MTSGKLHNKFLSECGIAKFSGRQYRTSRCLDNGFMEDCIAAGKEHQRQTRKCTPSCKKQLQSRPPKYLYDRHSDKNKLAKKQTWYKKDDRGSEDYEVVTNGDVEKTRKRSKKMNSKTSKSIANKKIYQNVKILDVKGNKENDPNNNNKGSRPKLGNGRSPWSIKTENNNGIVYGKNVLSAVINVK